MNGWVAAILGAALALTACRPAEVRTLDVRLTTQPARLQIGTAQIDLQLPESLTDAAVLVEGNMTHAGMVPVRAAAQRIGPGRYRVQAFPLTMAGDWVLTVSARPPQGPVQSKDVPVVVESQ